MIADTHDPDAVLDYAFDWTDWLADDETIESHVATAANATIDSSSEAAGVVTVWISAAEEGKVAVITCRIVTSGARVDDRSIKVWVSDR